MKVALSFHFQNFRDALLVEKQLRRQLKMLSMQRKYGSKLRLKKKSKFTSQIVWRSIQGSLS